MAEYGTRDWQHVPFEMERRGSLVGTAEFDELLVNHYVLDRAAEPLPSCAVSESPMVRFGPLALMGSWVEPDAASDSAVTLALCWQTAPGATDEVHAALTLLDPITGERLGQSSQLLLDTNGRPTSAWGSNEAVLTYHLLPVNPDTPPLAYDVIASVFTTDGDTRLRSHWSGWTGSWAADHPESGDARSTLLLAKNPYWLTNHLHFPSR
ncbi:MAG: hypothetical protein R3C44_05180 [Chloroflexota bacterium]